jgi:oligoendopeptidase F
MVRSVRRTGAAAPLFAVLLLVPWLAGAALAAGAAPSTYTPDPNAPRSAVPAGYEWRTENLFATPEAWDREFAAVSAEIPKLGAYAGHLSESPQQLYSCLEGVYNLQARLYNLYIYAESRFNVDQSVSENKARKGRLEMLFPTFSKTVAFIDPEILAIDQPVLDRFLTQSTDLKRYAFYLENVRRLKAHTLSPAEEKILALTGNLAGVPGDVNQALRTLDMKFPEIVDENGQKVPLTMTGFTKYRGSQVYSVRKQAAETFFATLRSYQNTLAASLDGVVKAHILTKEARGYNSCLEAALAPDNISPDAYKMLISTVDANLGRTLHRYVDLRRKVLGIDGLLTFSNLYNPLLDEKEPEYTFDQARDIVLTALKPLGEDYLSHLRVGLDPANGWVDVYPNANKEGGAYSTGGPRSPHPYVLLNFDNTLDAVSTTAHEFGHAMHSVYSSTNQPPVYADYTTFLAEIASTCNEALLTDYLLKQAKDPQTRLLLLNQRLESIRLTIFRQTLFAEFELLFHQQAEKGEVLTADFLNSTYKDLIQKYYGPNYALGPNDEMEWGFIPHFYRNFYVFSYATGLTSGISIAQQIEKSGKPAADRYINEMLKAGASAPPLVILRKAGVDLETPQPILDAMDLFEKTVQEFDALWTATYGPKTAGTN